MGIRELLGGSGSVDEEETDGTTCWCTECGMVFERSNPGIDYSWCTRCGAEGVRKLPWPRVERDATGAPGREPGGRSGPENRGEREPGPER